MASFLLFRTQNRRIQSEADETCISLGWRWDRILGIVGGGFQGLCHVHGVVHCFVILCLSATGWILSSTINFALMCLCFPRPTNTSRYSDISVDTTGSVGEVPVQLSVSCLASSWVTLITCNSPSFTLVSRLERGGDLVIPLATRKRVIVFFPVLTPSTSASKQPTRGAGSFWANAYNLVSVRCKDIFSSRAD